MHDMQVAGLASVRHVGNAVDCCLAADRRLPENHHVGGPSLIELNDTERLVACGMMSGLGVHDGLKP